jgi:hypothetical protein
VVVEAQQQTLFHHGATEITENFLNVEFLSFDRKPAVESGIFIPNSTIEIPSIPVCPPCLRGEIWANGFQSPVVRPQQNLPK